MMKFKYIFIAAYVACFCGCAANLQKVSLLYDKTTSRYEERVHQAPHDIGSRVELADFYYHLNDYASVIRLLEELDQEAPQALLAKAYVKAGEYTRAIEIFQALKDINDPEYLFLYARTLQEKNLFADAIKLYKKITTSPYKESAQEQIKSIGLNIEEGIPKEITEVLEKHKDFLKAIKDEEAVTLFADESHTVLENNTSVTSTHAAQKVLREKGKSIAEVEIDYDSTYERVELEYARTITPDGRVVYVGKQNTRDVSKYVNFPLYSNARVLIISMPAVEVGAIVEYKYKTFASKLVNKDDFSYIYALKDSNPICREHMELIVPAAAKVNFKEINMDFAGKYSLKPKEEKNGAQTRYIWHYEEVAPIIPEEGMPPAVDVDPAVISSTFTSWQEVYEWWIKLFSDKITLSEKTQKFITELTKDCKDDHQKLQKIQEFCAKEIRYVALEYGDGGYEPHQAEEVFTNRYGDCKDQATLLVAMLRAAGLKAYPVLIPTREAFKVYEDFASLNFNHAIACAEMDGKLIFMDPTSATSALEELPMDDQGRPVLVMRPDKYEFVTTPQLMNSAIDYKMDVTIESDESAKITRTVLASGTYAAAQRYFLKYTHPARIRESLQERARSISPFTQFIDYEAKDYDDFTKTPVLTYSFTADKLLNPAGDLRVLIPLGDVGIDAGSISKEERVFPVEFGGLFTKRAQIDVKLPANLIVKHMPSTQKVENEWFTFSTQYQKGDKGITVIQEFVMKNKFVPLKNYKEFKEGLQKVMYALREEVILEKQP